MNKFTHPLTESKFCSLTLHVWRHQSLVTPCRGNAGLSPTGNVPLYPLACMTHCHVIGHHDMTHLSTSTPNLFMSAQLGVPIPQSTLGMSGLKMSNREKAASAATKRNSNGDGFIRIVGPSYLYYKYVFEYILEKFQNYFKSPHPSCLETGLFKKQSSLCCESCCKWFLSHWYQYLPCNLPTSSSCLHQYHPCDFWISMREKKTASRRQTRNPNYLTQSIFAALHPSVAGPSANV